MSIGTALRSETAAWLLGGVAICGFSAVAFSLIGWIGIGIIGLIGLVISANITLQSGNAVAGGELGNADVSMYARQLDEARKSQSSPEQKMAAMAAQAKRSKLIYLINSVFIAMTALGFGLFVLHQL